MRWRRLKCAVSCDVIYFLEPNVKQGAAADELDRLCKNCGSGACFYGNGMASVCPDDGDEIAQRGLHSSVCSALLMAAVGEFDSNSTHSCTAMQAPAVLE